MTRKKIEKQYDHYDNGIIKQPGKFIGEQLYVPYLWDISLDNGNNGFALYECYYIAIDITDDDIKEFPEFKNDKQLILDGLFNEEKTIYLKEDSDGFIMEISKTAYQAAEKLSETEEY